MQQPEGGSVEVHLGPREEIGQRRAQIALQRHRPAGHQRRVGRQRVVQFEAALVSGGNLARLRIDSRYGAKKGGDGETQAGGVVFRPDRLVGMTVTHRDQRHAKAVRLVEIFQPRDLVIGDELESFEVVRLPAAALQHAIDVPRAGGRVDRLRCVGHEFLGGADDPQRRLQRTVVQIARAAILRVVLVAGVGEAGVEQIVVGVQDRRAVEIQRSLRIAPLSFFAADEGQLGHGIDGVGRRLAVADRLQRFEQGGIVAAQIVAEVVHPQQLHGSLAGLRSAVGGELQLVDQRALGDGAERDGAGSAACGRQQDPRQQNSGGKATACEHRRAAAWNKQC